MALALAAAKKGLSSHVVDRADPAELTAEGFDGRASAISTASWNLFGNIGLAERARAVRLPDRLDRRHRRDEARPDRLPARAARRLARPHVPQPPTCASRCSKRPRTSR